MKKLTLLSSVCFFALIASLHAADISLKGMACWTGERKMMAASNENWGMGFDIKGTYMDEISNEENSYFECAGHIHMVNGAMKGQTFNCMHYFADGSQALEIGEIKNDSGTKSTFLEGTGRHKGVLGEFTGGPRISMGKAPDNKFGACREIQGFKRLAD